MAIAGTCLALAGLLGLSLNESHLQGYIDDAQLAGWADMPAAGKNWLAAIELARTCGQPPALQADLHWQLGDFYVRHSQSVQDERLLNAIAQYELALDYYARGSHHRSYAFSLSYTISSLRRSIKDDSSASRRTAAAAVERLWLAKDYERSAQIGSEFLASGEDTLVASYTGCALNKLGISLPPRQGLRYFERAAYADAVASLEATLAPSFFVIRVRKIL